MQRDLVPYTEALNFRKNKFARKD